LEGRAVNAINDVDLFVLQKTRDGAGRVHDVHVVLRHGEMVLSCPSAFWSMTLTPEQCDLLAFAIRRAGGLAREQWSS
jgi:hypothetical protein